MTVRVKGKVVLTEVGAQYLREYVATLPIPVQLLGHYVASRAQAWIAENPDHEDREKLGQALLPFAELETHMDEYVARFAIEAFQAMPEAERQELSRYLAERLRKPQSLEQVQQVARTAIKQLVERLVDEEIQATIEVQRSRVKQLVDAAWDGELVPLVQKRLADAVARVKAEFAR